MWPFSRSDKRIARDTNGCVNLGNAGRDIIIYNYSGPPPPEPSLPWRPLPEDRDIFKLLDWRCRITDLIGRDEEMNELLSWAKNGGGISARFLIGPGGAGKSRLAAEVAQSLRDDGWSAGFVPLDGDAVYPYKKHGAFLIVDYPEENREAVEKVLKILARTESTDERTIRLLFLSREGGTLWQGRIDAAKAASTFNAAPVTVGHMKSEEDAYAVFSKAQQKVRKANAAAPQPISKEALATWLQRAPTNHRPLFILAAAIHSVHEPETSVVTLSGAEVVQALAQRERSRLQPESKAHDLGDHGLERLTALAAISGGLSEDDIRRLADPELEIGLPSTTEVIDKVNATGRTANNRLPAPVPDIVAAAFLTDVLAERPDMAPEWIWAALESDVDAGLERLGRLSFDAEIELGLRQFPYGEALASMVKDKADRSRACEHRSSQQPLALGLVPLAVAVWRTLLTHAEDDIARAGYLNSLSEQLSAAGDTQGALEASREAVSTMRGLAAAQPERFNPNFAASLNNFSNCLSAAGDTQGALEASREAVTITRSLAAAQPERLNPNFAGNLNNLSNRLSTAGDAAGALEAIREAVTIYRGLAAAQPERFKPDLAMSLNGLSNRLNTAGDPDGALEAIREAVTIYRGLAAAQPERFKPALATSLNNLSNRLKTAADPDGALEAIREAVTIYRGLAAAQPERFNPDLAMSLNNLSAHLSAAGDDPGALSLLAEALALLEPFAQRYPNSENGRWRDTIRARLAKLRNETED